MLKNKYFWETLIILTHSKEEIKAHHYETLKTLIDEISLPLW